MSGTGRPWKVLLLALLMTATGLASALGPRAPRGLWVSFAFFGLCSVVLLHAVVTGGRRASSSPPPGAESPVGTAPALGPAELARRRPVWSALSGLFLDTELQPSDHVWIARRLRDSGYDDATLLGILDDEVGPVCGPNLLSVAGEWSGFDEEWLERSILANLGARPAGRWLSRRGTWITRRMVGGDLGAVTAALARLRQDPAVLARDLAGAPGAAARAAAARELAFLGRDAASAAAALRAAAGGDPDGEVRAAAVEAAWRVERLGALDLASAALADPAPRARRAAVEVLAEATVDPAALRRAAPRAVPAGAVSAAVAFLADREAGVRKSAAFALGALASLGAPDALDAALSGLDEADGGVRVALGRAAVLAGAGEARLAPVVDALAAGPTARRRTAAQILVLVAQQGGADAGWALRELVAALRVEDPVVRRHAAVALGWLRGAAAEARPLLAAGMADADPELRAACLGALSRVDAALGTPPLELLVSALDAPERLVRNAASAALHELGAAAAPALARLEVLAQGRGLGGCSDRRSAAKVLVDRIRKASGPASSPS